MGEGIKFFVGLDVHKDSISVAACDASRGQARFVGTVDSDVNELLKVPAKAGAPAAGELKSIWVPGEAHEAMRDLCRTPEDAVSARQQASKG